MIINGHKLITHRELYREMIGYGTLAFLKKEITRFAEGSPRYESLALSIQQREEWLMAQLESIGVLEDKP